MPQVRREGQRYRCNGPLSGFAACRAVAEWRRAATGSSVLALSGYLDGRPTRDSFLRPLGQNQVSTKPGQAQGWQRRP